MNNSKSNKSRMIFNYIGYHPEYGQHPNVCHICGNNYDVTGRFIFEGNQGAIWEGEHFEFPICTCCFYEELSHAMTQMDSVMLQRQIDEEKEWEKYWEEYEPYC